MAAENDRGGGGDTTPMGRSRGGITFQRWVQISAESARRLPSYGHGRVGAWGEKIYVMMENEEKRLFFTSSSENWRVFTYVCVVHI